MSMKRAFSAVLVGGLALTLSGVARAQGDGSRIEEVVKKSALTPEDLAVIDGFVGDAIGRLVRTIDFTAVAATRTTILSRQGTQPEYARRFSQATARELARGFEYARTEISSPENRFKVLTNLLILINDLNDPNLLDLAIDAIPHENSAVRYWAVRAATNPGTWAKLSSGQGNAAQIASRVVGACLKVVGTSRPEILHLMAAFTDQYSSPAATDLLLRIGDERIGSYADWAVRYELVDTAILKRLSNQISSGGTTDQELAKRFSQLYSFAIQRFIRGSRDNALKGLSKNYLAAVLVETEEQCIGKLLGSPQAGIQRALQAGDLGALQAEHDKLLGGPNQPGALPSKFRFTYGAAGRTQQMPLTLPEPPQPKAPGQTQPGS